MCFFFFFLGGKEGKNFTLLSSNCISRIAPQNVLINIRIRTRYYLFGNNWYDLKFVFLGSCVRKLSFILLYDWKQLLNFGKKENFFFCFLVLFTFE